jgi:hypothetical protein
MHSSKRIRLDWIWGVLFKPRKTFSDILGGGTGARPGSSWLTPLLFLTITGLILVLVSGWIQGQAAVAPELSPDFQYLSPDQQNQMLQALQMRQGPVFRYVFPALTAVLGVWLGWLLVGGMLHLIITLQGGRGDTSSAMNLVAWSSLPYAVRDILQTIFLLVTRKLISAPGLSGFMASETGGLNLFLVKLLVLVDIYLLWRIILLVIGVKAAAGFSTGKALLSALIPLLILFLLQAGMGYLGTSLGSLSIVRMFF